MKLEIIECDKCGRDCSDYENHVVVQYPKGEQKFLCRTCADAVFAVEKPQTENKEE